MTEQSQAPANKLAVIKGYMRSAEIIRRFEEAIGKREAMPFISSVMLAVSSNQDLIECNPQSIAVSAMRAATMRLTCDPAFGYAHIVPYKGKATFIVGYKGMVHIALRFLCFHRVLIRK